MFVNHCNINNGDYHVRRQFDREPSRRPLKKLEKFSRKNKQIKKLVFRRILKNIPVSSKMYRYVKCRLRTRNNNDSIKFVQKMRKKMAFYSVNTESKIVELLRVFGQISIFV